MSTFTVQLLAFDRGELIADVRSFVGEDDSGSFGLMARHERCLTVLSFGLARMHMADGSRRFIGLPGGVLDFDGHLLRIVTRRYLLDADAARVGAALADELVAEERAIARTREEMRRLETAMLQRLARFAQETRRDA